MEEENKIGYIGGQCPRCKSMNIEYGVEVPDSHGRWYPFTCLKCGAKGKEYYNIEFYCMEIEE